MQKINCFIVHHDKNSTCQTVTDLKKLPLIDKIYLLCPTSPSEEIPDADGIIIGKTGSTSIIKTISDYSTADYSLIYIGAERLETGLYMFERLMSVASDTQAGLVYADYYESEGGVRKQHPVIDYCKGSVRDDFEFGPLLFFHAKALREAVSITDEEYTNAALYDLRLKISRKYQIIHLGEYLYTTIKNKNQSSDNKHFNYVDPKNREVQREMEKVFTEHLKHIGAYLPERKLTVNLEEGSFPVEASVIIPVHNRERTIEDAIRSVITQKTSFPFNLIIVNNHSTDATTRIIEKYDRDKLIHIRPERKDLGIGGCWNVGVHHPECGRFAIQLDSDDIYSDEFTLQKIVDTFHKEQCAMVIGSYRITNFNLETLPPGVIDHREWTPENGHNNALRINGLGAPRAFFTPLLRRLNLPNTSYGEDYCIALRICREYRIARIYEILYLCRRWEGNSDAALNISKANTYNIYKDKIRMWELEARINMNNE